MPFFTGGLTLGLAGVAVTLGGICCYDFFFRRRRREQPTRVVGRGGRVSFHHRGQAPASPYAAAAAHSASRPRQVARREETIEIQEMSRYGENLDSPIHSIMFPKVGPNYKGLKKTEATEPPKEEEEKEKQDEEKEQDDKESEEDNEEKEQNDEESEENNEEKEEEEK